MLRLSRRLHGNSITCLCCRNRFSMMFQDWVPNAWEVSGNTTSLPLGLGENVAAEEVLKKLCWGLFNHYSAPLCVNGSWLEISPKTILTFWAFGQFCLSCLMSLKFASIFFVHNQFVWELTFSPQVRLHFPPWRDTQPRYNLVYDKVNRISIERKVMQICNMAWIQKHLIYFWFPLQILLVRAFPDPPSPWLKF